MLNNVSHAINLRALAIGALGFVLATQALESQGRSQYREFQLGGNLASIVALTGVGASETRTIHLRPAIMQELQWQRPYSSSDPAIPQTDPVKQILFSFYNDQLSKMVVDYDRDRTAGMTDADLIDAISTEYGPQLKPGARSGRGVVSRVDEESGTPVARWGGTDCSVVLYRGYTSGFRLIVASPRLEALARTADVQATRLDSLEAPKREIARQKKETDDARTSQAKARLANKAAFRP
jgi:hypothetical protein